MSFCNTCFHPCHCGDEIDLHADEYGVCTCEGCNCKKVKEEDKTWENEIKYE